MECANADGATEFSAGTLHSSTSVPPLRLAAFPDDWLHVLLQHDFPNQLETIGDVLSLLPLLERARAPGLPGLEVFHS